MTTATNTTTAFFNALFASEEISEDSYTVADRYQLCDESEGYEDCPGIICDRTEARDALEALAEAHEAEVHVVHHEDAMYVCHDSKMIAIDLSNHWFKGLTIFDGEVWSHEQAQDDPEGYAENYKEAEARGMSVGDFLVEGYKTVEEYYAENPE
jgi:hypothetical protein